MGEVGILNVGAGDTKLTFDPSKPEEVKRAARVVTDMLRRGFALLVQVGENEKGPLFQRAHDFDPDTAEYIIIGTPEEQDVAKPPSTPRARKGGRKAGQTRIAAVDARAVAVARTSGG